MPPSPLLSVSINHLLEEEIVGFADLFLRLKKKKRRNADMVLEGADLEILPIDFFKNKRIKDPGNCNLLRAVQLLVFNI